VPRWTLPLRWIRGVIAPSKAASNPDGDDDDRDEDCGAGDDCGGTGGDDCGDGDGHEGTEVATNAALDAGTRE
jgi:hypothetical protein